jgi:hypothetical protein
VLQPDIEIHKELRLPTFKRGANEPLLAWPPQQPSLAAQMASMPVPSALDRIGTRRSKNGGVRRARASQLITRNESEKLRSAGRPSFARPARRIDGSMDGSSLPR